METIWYCQRISAFPRNSSTVDPVKASCGRTIRNCQHLFRQIFPTLTLPASPKLRLDLTVLRLYLLRILQLGDRLFNVLDYVVYTSSQLCDGRPSF